jgi:hypothetical protein
MANHEDVRRPIGRAGAISVGPVPGGWRLEAAVCGQALMFLSGACAERQARALARQLAGLGYDMRVEIHDREDNLAARLLYPATVGSPEAVLEPEPGTRH